VDEVKAGIHEAATTLRTGILEPRPVLEVCKGCDYRRMFTPGLEIVDHGTP
jgi:hypothetical protein